MSEFQKAIECLEKFKKEISLEESIYEDSINIIDDRIESIELVIKALEKQYNNRWIPVIYKLPKHKQQVLTYYRNENSDVEQMNMLVYCNKGEALDIDNTMDRQVFTTVQEDGFYIYNCVNDNPTYKLYPGIVTHWMLLPESLKEYIK